MKGETNGKEKYIHQEKKFLILTIEEEGETKELTLEEGQICLEGFRQLNGRLVRGVPKKGPKDCLKYCRHEGCDFL